MLDKSEMREGEEVIFGHSMLLKDGIMHIRCYRPSKPYMPNHDEELIVDGYRMRYKDVKEGGRCHLCALEERYCTGLACDSGYYVFVDEKLEAAARARAKKRAEEYTKRL
jgi:hypothetical protein